MVIRDAHPDDAPALASLGIDSLDAAARLLERRTVRIHTGEEPTGDHEGFVSFDATEGAVHVTHLAGDASGYPALLAEPIRFAEAAGLPIETVVPDGAGALCEALESAEFSPNGDGPRFDNAATTRYRRPVTPPSE